MAVPFALILGLGVWKVIEAGGNAGAMFLNGINEKQGWLQAGAGGEAYRETSNYYEALRARSEAPPVAVGRWRCITAWRWDG